jgi:hypothetical protein
MPWITAFSFENRLRDAMRDAMDEIEDASIITRSILIPRKNFQLKSPDLFHPGSDRRQAKLLAGQILACFCPIRLARQTSSTVASANSLDCNFEAERDLGGWFNLLYPPAMAIRKDLVNNALFGFQHALPGGERFLAGSREGRTRNCGELAF